MMRLVEVSLKAICSEMKLDPRIARENLRLAVREAKKYPELAKAHKLGIRHLPPRLSQSPLAEDSGLTLSDRGPI
jgi:hypothetical protein